uniref:(northern house mosquito) hypothetical protein n=2 Tax=Culex pipiens TaxID=7175 RepID=A0A8D8FWC6_CULPI
MMIRSRIVSTSVSMTFSTYSTVRRPPPGSSSVLPPITFSSSTFSVSRSTTSLPVSRDFTAIRGNRTVGGFGAIGGYAAPLTWVSDDVVDDFASQGGVLGCGTSVANVCVSHHVTG